MDIDNQFIEGQLSDARQQFQRALTSVFMAEDRMRHRTNPDTAYANKLFELRKQIAITVQNALGEQPCRPPQSN